MALLGFRSFCCVLSWALQHHNKQVNASLRADVADLEVQRKLLTKEVETLSSVRDALFSELHTSADLKNQMHSGEGTACFHTSNR